MSKLSRDFKKAVKEWVPMLTLIGAGEFTFFSIAAAFSLAATAPPLLFIGIIGGGLMGGGLIARQALKMGN